MRFKSRGVLLALIAVFAMSAIAASAASAALPEFKPVPAKKKFTSTSGSVVMASGANTITCGKSSGAGEITGAATVGKVVITYKECSAKIGGGTPCEVKSPTGGKGEVISSALKGELGSVKTTEAPSGVGLLLEAEKSGGTLTTLVGGCFSPTESKLDGYLIGEVATVGKKALTNGLVFGVTSSKQNIKSITVKGGTKTFELSFEGAEWTIATSDGLTFEEALEVT